LTPTLPTLFLVRRNKYPLLTDVGRTCGPSDNGFSHGECVIRHAGVEAGVYIREHVGELLRAERYKLPLLIGRS
jgi:hypothetical protein